MRGRRRHTLAALSTLACLAACSGSPVSRPTATHELPPSTLASPASPAPSPTGTDAIPAAARNRTPAGAEAFVRYFVDQVNVAWTTPQTGLISALSLPTCKSCAALERRAATLKQSSTRYASQSLTLREVQWGTDSATQRDLVTATVIDSPVPTSSKGVPTPSTGSPNAQPSAFELSWMNDHWRVDEIKVLK